MESTDLQRFEERLMEDLLRACKSEGFDGRLLQSDDIDDYWQTIIEKYVADAVMEVVSYPLVSVAWAAYLGMAVAYCWDLDWATYSTTPYEQFYGTEGFDNMDDHIVHDILNQPADSDEARRTVAIVQNLARHTVSFIRHADIEPQSKLAYQAFVSATTIMFRIGASIQLHRLGYKMEKLQ